MTRRRRLTILLGLALTATPLAARGEDMDRAKTLFNAGAQAYDAGQYPVAIQAFEEAYKAAQRPSILFSLAQAERKSYAVTGSPADLRNAVTHYRAYLEQVQTGGRRNDAADALAELTPALARLDGQNVPPPPPPVTSGSASGSSSGAIVPPPPPITTVAGPSGPPKTRLFITSSTPGAVIAVDGVKGTGATFTLEDATAGTHKVHVSADGYVDADRDAIVAAGGGFFTQDVELTEKPGILSLDCDDGADVTIDGRLVATTPLVTPLQYTSGTHYLVVTKNGHKAFSKEITLERGKTLNVAVPLDKSGQRVASLVVFGSAAVAALAGATFATISFIEQDRAQKVLDNKGQGNIQGSDIDTYDSAIDARDRWKTASLISFGAGLGLLATGVVLFAFDKPSVPPSSALPDSAPKTEPVRKPDNSMELSAAPIVMPGVVGLSIGGRM
jgi:hypothetical protein